jgi:predicted Zn-dependent protease
MMAMVLAFAAIASASCAGWKQQSNQAKLTSDRQDRAAEAIRNFEEQRDAAQYQAALDRCRQGDAARAETLFAALSARRPDFVEARLRLAEILWSRGDASAEAHFRTVLTAEPSRAEAHHSLGLLLDATGRGDEARNHFSEAAKLEPDNEIYRATVIF